MESAWICSALNYCYCCFTFWNFPIKHIHLYWSKVFRDSLVSFDLHLEAWERQSSTTTWRTEDVRVIFFLQTGFLQFVIVYDQILYIFLLGPKVSFDLFFHSIPLGRMTPARSKSRKSRTAACLKAGRFWWSRRMKSRQIAFFLAGDRCPKVVVHTSRIFIYIIHLIYNVIITNVHRIFIGECINCQTIRNLLLSGSVCVRSKSKINFPWIEVGKGSSLGVIVLVTSCLTVADPSLIARSVDPSPSISIRGWRLLEGGGELWFPVFLGCRWQLIDDDTIGPSSGHHPSDLRPEHLHHRLRSLHKVAWCLDVLRLHFLPTALAQTWNSVKAYKSRYCM